MGAPWDKLDTVKLRGPRRALKFLSGYDLYVTSSYRVCPYCGEAKRYLSSHIGAMRRWHPKSHRRKRRAQSRRV